MKVKQLIKINLIKLTLNFNYWIFYAQIDGFGNNNLTIIIEEN